MNKIRILLADDDRVFCELVGNLMRKEGYLVDAALDTEQAREYLRRNSYDLAMLDLYYPALSDGFDLLEEVLAKYPQLLVLMISGSGRVPDVVRAIRGGATDFIEKPVQPEHLLVRIQNLSERVRKEWQLQALEQTTIGMVGVSDAMQKVFGEISAAAAYDNPVLLTGETGVGKELAARAIHRLSKHNQREMVCVNCASIPSELFEAELFGYEKGAFTGAIQAYRGYFEFAYNSTLFLDEISELPPGVQAKLLRVISEGEVPRLGGKISQTNTRIVSATNQNLQEMIKKGSFRQDLYYRLNVVHIHIPPLRERPEDILPLANHFMFAASHARHLPPREISAGAELWLTRHEWPGNARELRNAVERALILSQRDTLEQEDFLEEPGAADYCDLPPVGILRESLRQYEARLLSQYLQANLFNISQTARMLGVDKSNLSKRLRFLGIPTHG